MVVYRPHRCGLYEAMLEAKEFETIDDMLDYIIKDHNDYCGNMFTINKNDLVIYNDDNHRTTCKGDNRVGWKNIYSVLYNSYLNISDKKGYLWYFGIKAEEIEEEFSYDNPCGITGSFSTDYIMTPLEWLSKQKRYKEKGH